MTTQRTPRDLGFRMPAEWERHRACWLAYPFRSVEWAQDLRDAQEEWIELARAILARDAEGRATERLEILTPDEQAEREIAALVGEEGVRFHRALYGDSWTRDTAPLFLVDDEGGRATVRFRFDGWGGKYVMPGDSDVAAFIAERAAPAPSFASDLVTEGGALEVDGRGTCLLTRPCLIDAARNPGRTQQEIEAVLHDSLAVSRFVWLDEGLANDHTDGHIDTLARFVAEGAVVCMEPRTDDDPNRDALRAIIDVLAVARDAQGHKLELVRIPSPGRVTTRDGHVLPASYCNFYVANQTVVVPTYGTPADDAAVHAIGALFPGRRAVGSSALAILTGGGAFHCVTQQEPDVVRESGARDDERARAPARGSR